MAAKITYTIQKELGDLSIAPNGWKKQEKFDLRSWNEDHTAMTKGITLTKEEALKLRDILNEIDFDEL